MEKAFFEKMEDRPVLAKIWNIMFKIREILIRYQKTIDIEPYFKSFDVRGDGVISYREFMNVFTIHLRNLLNLSESQVRDIADFFKTTDGRIMYKRFLECFTLKADSSDSQRFSSLNEWNDLYSPNVIDKDETKRFELILNEIAGRVFTTNTSLPAVFREYEVVSRKFGVMPIGQFATALGSLQIRLNNEDFFILVKRYLSQNFAINAVRFAQDVEDRINDLIRCGQIDQYQLVDEREIIVPKPKLDYIEINPQHDSFPTEPAPHPGMRQIYFDERPKDLIQQIQFIVNSQRINMEQFFVPYDNLRKGIVSDFQFKRAVGISGLQKYCQFNENELKVLCDIYRVFTDPTMVNYRCFINDLKVTHNSTCPNNCHHVTMDEMQKRTHIRGNYFPHTTKVHKNACEVALMKLRKYLRERNITLITQFRREDKHHSNHVRPDVFRRVLVDIKANFLLDAIEMKSIDDRFIDLYGFNYQRFLDEVHEEIKNLVPSEKDMTAKLFEDQKDDVIESTKPIQSIELPSVAEVINKLKLQIRQRPVDLESFLRQFNLPKQNEMPARLVWNALATAGLHLEQPDYDVLKTLFGVPFHNDIIDIKHLLETVYSDEYQLGLEKNPLIVPVAGIPVTDGQFNSLNYPERLTLQKLMLRLATKAEFFLQDLFKEFDKRGTGIIQKLDFTRALSYLGRDIEYMLRKEERDLVYKAFSTKRGFITGLDYPALCNAVKAVRGLNPI